MAVLDLEANKDNVTVPVREKVEEISAKWYISRLRKFKYYFHNWYKLYNVERRGFGRSFQLKGFHFVCAAYDLSYMDVIRAPCEKPKQRTPSLGYVKLGQLDQLIVGTRIVVVYNLDDKRFHLFHKKDNSDEVIPFNDYLKWLETVPNSKVKLDKKNFNTAFEIRVMSREYSVTHKSIKLTRSQGDVVPMWALVNAYATIQNIENKYNRKNEVCVHDDNKSSASKQCEAGGGNYDKRSDNVSPGEL